MRLPLIAWIGIAALLAVFSAWTSHGVEQMKYRDGFRAGVEATIKAIPAALNGYHCVKMPLPPPPIGAR